MALAPTGELFRVTLIGTSDGSGLQNVLHFRGNDPSITATNMLAQVLAFLPLKWGAIMSNAARWDKVRVQTLTPLVLDLVEGAVLNGTGTVGTGPINNTLSCVTTIRTGAAGKRRRGRIYLGGIPSSFVTGQVLNTTGINAIAQWAVDMITEWGPNGGQSSTLGVYSRATGGNGPIYNTGGFHVMTTLQPQGVLGNQRRRRLGVGI